MTAPTNYWRLGLFIVLGLVVAVAVLGYFGRGALHREKVQYATYFDQSVEGIAVGAPVHFRGVTIGRVDDLRFAPDRRHVEVLFGLGVREMRRLGLVGRDQEPPALEVTPDMRVQLALTTIIGEQVLDIDYFDPATHPPPALSFPVPDRYIPSTSSVLSGLEDSLAKAASQLPALVEDASRLVGGTDRLVSGFNEQRLADSTEQTLQGVRDLTRTLRKLVDRTSAAELPQRLGVTLNALDAELSRLDQVFERLDGQGGLLPSAQRATDAVGDLARGTHGVGPRLDAAVREIRDTAAAVRRVASDLERNPDMLVKGRARGGP
ncbi:MAG TPA: MlaD family protein [Polyangiaceae bacterium]|nr:MlaD family protein [Polyangiaceae bacterium]